ncbi:cardiolipin synthase ClsB [soil metagenome]
MPAEQTAKYFTGTKASAAFSDNNKVKLIRGGKVYFEMLLSMIGQASENIHLQTYIFTEDKTGLLVADALMAAAKRNVQVYLLADGYASQALSEKLIERLQQAGVHFRFFEPLLKSRHYYFGRRLHQKIFVADGRCGLVGGLNIADRYNDMPGIPSWLDFAVFIEGEVARQLCVLCWKTWNGFPAKLEATSCDDASRKFDFIKHEASSVRMRRNDWVRRKNEISATYVEMLRRSKSHVTIISSYFLPGKIIRRLLKNATKRGVKIKVITAGPSDVMVAKHAERWMYDWLLRNNIELYEYQPAVLHAKVAVCDSEWFTIGSYNINNISAYASIELNLDVRNKAMATEMENMMEDIIQEKCLAITANGHVYTRNIFIRFIRWCSYQFIRMAFYMLTFYFKQRRR